MAVNPLVQNFPVCKAFRVEQVPVVFDVALGRPLIGSDRRLQTEFLALLPGERLVELGVLAGQGGQQGGRARFEQDVLVEQVFDVVDHVEIVEIGGHLVRVGRVGRHQAGV